MFSTIKSLHAQSKSIYQDWTPWETVYEEQSYPDNIKFQISFKFTYCTKDGSAAGWPYYRTNNEFSRKGATLSFTFDYKRCDGKIGTESVNYDLEKQGIGDNQGGQWFMGYEVTRIYDVKLTDPNKDKIKNLQTEYQTAQQGFNSDYDDLKKRIDLLPGTDKENLRQKLNDIKKQWDETKSGVDESIQKNDGNRMEDQMNTLTSLKNNLHDLNGDVASGEQQESKKKEEAVKQKEDNDKKEADKHQAEEAEKKIEYQNSRKQWHEDQKKEIENNKQQATEAMTGSAAAMAGLVSAGIASNKENNFFQKASAHIGLGLGLAAPIIPVVINSEISSSSHPTVNSSTVESPMQVGFTGCLSFHPFINQYFSLGLFGSGTYAFSPAIIAGGGSSLSTDVSNETSTESIATFNYNYGGQIALGLKKVKVLGGFFLNNYSTAYLYKLTSDIYNGDNTLTDVTNRYADVSYKAQRIELGLRLGSYKKTCFDLINLRYGNLQ